MPLGFVRKSHTFFACLLLIALWSFATSHQAFAQATCPDRVDTDMTQLPEGVILVRVALPFDSRMMTADGNRIVACKGAIPGSVRGRRMMQVFVSYRDQLRKARLSVRKRREIKVLQRVGGRACECHANSASSSSEASSSSSQSSTSSSSSSSSSMSSSSSSAAGCVAPMGFQKIETEAQLRDINEPLQNYYLCNDIMLTQPFPILFPQSEYRGIFEGNNRAITNLSILQPDALSAGMFGILGRGTVQNLDLVNVNVEGNISVGALAGLSEATIRNVRVLGGSVVGSGSGWTGALVGFNAGPAPINCSASIVEGPSQLVGYQSPN